MEQKSGFLLTAKGVDSDYGHSLHFFGKGTDGPFELVFDDIGPVVFIPQSTKLPQGIKIKERKSVSLKSFQGEPVDALYFKKFSDIYNLRDRHSEIRTYEADVRPTERFLMERFIKGHIEFKGESRLENGVDVYHNPLVKSGTKTDIRLSSMSFDIETSRGSDLFSIGLHFCDGHNDIQEVFMIGENQGSLEKGHLFYYPDEKSCYQAFEKRVQELDPDLILGWHVVGFDLKLLEKKCAGWGIDMCLGRKKSRLIVNKAQNSSQHFAKVDGRVVIDGPPVLRAAFYQFEDFKLDTVAHEILGTRKDIESTGLEKVKEIERRFRDDKVSLAKYNLLDCTLVTDIVKKVNLIELLQERVRLCGLLMDRLAVSTAAFDFSMLPLVHRKGFVAPNTLDIVRGGGASGGHVLTPNPGLHDHVIVLDFKSLYPTIIRTFCIDPYSRLMADTNPISTPAGIKFSKTEHLLPAFIKELMEKREEAKNAGNSALSQAIKILMNSFYGVMGSGGCRFYHADLPTAITGTGQWLLREAIDFIEGDGFSVVYGDTDSIFVKLPSGDRVFERGQNLATRTNEYLRKQVSKNFGAESALEMEFEKYFRKIFFPILRSGTEAAKKKYTGIVLNEDKESELTFSGMEFVRSDTTKLAKKFQYKLYEEFFAGDSLEDTIRNTVKDLRDGVFDQELVYKKRLSKSIDEYTKSIPPHVKAALMAREAGFEIERDVYYVVTRRGPVPIELDHSDIDYNHYIDKQIRPIAEVVLTPLELNFDNIVVGDQLSLF